MGLDDFKTDRNENSVKEDVDNTELYNDSMFGSIDFPIKNRGRGMEHYISKQRISFQLASMGYDVYTDVKIDGAIYDFYANAVVKGNEVDIVGEVGPSELEKIYNVKNKASPFVWVKSGLGLDEAILMSEIEIQGEVTPQRIDNLEDYSNDPPETLDSMGETVYINEDGRPFIPRHDLIMTEGLRDVSEMILLTYTDGRMIDVENLYEKLKDKGVSRDEIQTVLKHLEFRG